MSALRDFQSGFVHALLDPHPAARDRFGAGFAVYRNTVAKGLVDVLRANYPTVLRLTGDEWFDAAAQQFAHAQLPDEPALALYGAAFPQFLAGVESARELEYWPAVAQLDRLWTEAHFAIEAPSLRAAALYGLSPMQLQDLCVRLHPAARHAWVPHSAATIWRRNRPPATPPDELEISDEDEGVLITRPAGDICSALLTHAEYLFVQKIDQEMSLGESALAVLDRYPDTDVAAMLARFIMAGAFADQ